MLPYPAASVGLVIDAAATQGMHFLSAQRWGLANKAKQGEQKEGQFCSL
jgi:hypothetical protein